MKSSRLTLAEVIVASLVLVVLVALAFPAVMSRSRHVKALKKMKLLGTGLSAYVVEHGGEFPVEDFPAGNTWENAARPEANDTWYNAIPRAAGRKGVGDFASSPREFYRPDNLLYLPNARYPNSDKRLRRPYFAVAFNSKLRRKDMIERGEKVKLSQMEFPSRIVVLLESGMPGEAEPSQFKLYDGECKGNRRSFIGRHRNAGFLVFADGHVELLNVDEALDDSFRFPPDNNQLLWSLPPKDIPDNSGPTADLK
jgi:prepilin-type processing-associated H-X9-DG protein